MEELEYRCYTTKAEVDKAINTLTGILEGIKIDDWVNAKELNEFLNWCELHRIFKNRHPFNELFKIIDYVMEDGILTEDEAQDILYVCNNMRPESQYYNMITAGIQELEGILHGIMADNVLNDDEIHGLSNWMAENDYLKGVYPFSEIDSLLLSVLRDQVVTDDEKNMLMVYFSDFIDLTKSNNIDHNKLLALRSEHKIGGICAACPEIDIDGRTFCFTGISTKATRSEIAARIMDRGGIFKDTVTDKTSYLVVGSEGNPCWAFASYGRKVEKAMGMRRAGHPIVIIHEVDFWDAMVE